MGSQGKGRRLSPFPAATRGETGVGKMDSVLGILRVTEFSNHPGFLRKKFASGCPRNDDSHAGRPMTSPLFALLKRIPLFQSTSRPASDSPTPGEDAPDCKTENNSPDSSPPPPPPRSRVDKLLRTSHCATALDKNVVHRSPPPIHADRDAALLQPFGELLASELRPLIRIEDYRVARRPCGRPALSELGVKVSLQPAQALRTPL